MSVIQKATAPPSLPHLKAKDFLRDVRKLDEKEQQAIMDAVPLALTTLVDTVTPHGPAALANIAPGHRLFTIGGKPASEYVAQLDQSDKDGGVVVVFCNEDNRGSETWEATFACKMIGITQRHPIEHLELLVKDPERVYKDSGKAQWLWNEGLWFPLLRLATTALETEHRRNTPWLVMRAAAMLELGQNPAEAKSDVEEYLKEHVKSHTSNWGAIAIYCRTLYQPVTEKLKWLSASYDYFRTKRCAAALSAAFPQRPPLDAEAPDASYVGKQWPAPFQNYPVIRDSTSAASAAPPAAASADDGEAHAEAKPFSFGAEITKMRPRQLMLIILMASYRVNGPYNDLMRYLRVLYKDHPSVFSQITVITENNVPVKTVVFQAGENEAMEAGVPLRLVHDPDKAAMNFFPAVRGLPHLFTVDSNGSIVSESRLGLLWDVIGVESPKAWVAPPPTTRAAWAAASSPGQNEGKAQWLIDAEAQAAATAAKQPRSLPASAYKPAAAPRATSAPAGGKQRATGDALYSPLLNQQRRPVRKTVTKVRCCLMVGPIPCVIQ